MRLLAFDKAGKPGVAAVVGGEAVDLSRLPGSKVSCMEDLVNADSATLSRLSEQVGSAGADLRVPVSSLRTLMPLQQPGKILCMGLNYAEHAKEGGNPIPTYPALFVRVNSSMIAHDEPVIRPRVSANLDYEAELMIVIGKRARHVSEENALDHVFGYTIFNDVSVRDYQRKSNQWTPGKNFDGTGPVGPVIVTPDELPAGCEGLRIQSRLNGKVMQDGNISDMIFPVARTIAILSEFATLEPGDMIATGTPSGVGYARKPPVFMQPGDVIEIDIEKIGVLSNPIADEVSAAAE